MKTVVAETVLLGKEAFETLGEVRVIPDRQIGPEHLKEADALIIRSKTKVTPELLAGSAVRFVGTATAGFEHIDVHALEKSGIGWTAAPGCNADSVADYMTAALLYFHTSRGMELDGKIIGIIGVGQVGSRVAQRAEALGLRVLLNDPPRAAREFDASLLLGNTKSTFDFVSGPNIGENSTRQRSCFHPLETILKEADFVTLHVPLIQEKPWPTLKMADGRFFEQMKHGAVFINASRGKVLDSDALLHAKANGLISHAVLDVWDPEPAIRAEVLAAATIATPHIAGHSFEGKLNGTVQVYQEACNFFEVKPAWDLASRLPKVDVPELKLDSKGKSDLEVMAEAVAAVYDIGVDQLTPDDIERFDKLRSSYRVRREFKNTAVFLSEQRPELSRRIEQAGFHLNQR